MDDSFECHNANLYDSSMNTSSQHGLIFLRVMLLLFPLSLAACNPFLVNYSGEKLPKVKTVQVVMTAPDPDSVRWIGRSDFTSTRELKDAQAISAAKQVGADIVEWSDKDAGTKLEWTSAPVSYNAWTGNVASIPLPVVRSQFRYQARFYRSKSLGDPGDVNWQKNVPPGSVPPVDENSKEDDNDTKSAS